MLKLSSWPAWMQVIIRPEHPHPGAALSLFEDAAGWGYQAVATTPPARDGWEGRVFRSPPPRPRHA